jgi:hypothetical protein
MKRVVRLVLTVFVLACAVSTASFADGGSPAPTCSPGRCTTSTSGPIR